MSHFDLERHPGRPGAGIRGVIDLLILVGCVVIAIGVPAVALLLVAGVLA